MLSSGRFFLKNMESLPKACCPMRYCSEVKQSEIGVVIPRRIERSPTDILKALSSTIERDPTAFHYKYPDDPYFYPFSNNERRIYALSKESGRKSARWIIENNPGFFKNQLSDPPIEAFLPKQVFDEKSEVTEKTLVGAIEQRNVADAITVYKLLQKQNTVISNEVKQNLLELVCFYNAEEKPNKEELEFKWFANFDYKELEMNIWKEKSFAETLFKSMDPNCPLANSAMIQGMIKYNNVNAALEIFNRAKNNNVKFSTGVYNALLSEASNTNAEIADGFSFIKDVLREMAAKNINPNLATLNATLQSLMRLYRVRGREVFAKNLIMEFLHLGISPSLGTYQYLFRILASSRKTAQRNTELFFKLLSIIQSTKFEVMHPSDFQFFPQVMNIFSTVCKNIELVNHLNAILFQGGNMKFFESSLSESKYFRNYLIAIFKMEPLEVAMEKYKEVIPTIYSPELDVLSVALSAVVENGSSEYLVELWEDLKRLKMNKFRSLLIKIIPLAKVLTDEAAVKVIHEAAINCVAELSTSRQDIVSNVLIAFLKLGDKEKALEVFEKVKDLKNANALLNAESLVELFTYALENKHVSILRDCLEYASDEYYVEVLRMGEMALPLLSQDDQVWLTELLRRAKETEKEEDEQPSSSSSAQ